jgi:predicted RNA binding protein YcfA (HicA-like mRNA interferase family)
MPELKVLSGVEVIKILKKFDFKIVKQKGSHVKLKRIINSTNQTLTIPNHKELDKGTTKAIYNQISSYVSESELKKYFYDN